MRFLIALFILFSGFLASAQKSGIPKYRDIIIVNPASILKFQVKVKKQSTTPSNKYTYSWYNNDKIQSTQGGYDGILLDGLYKEYDLSERLLVQGEYKKGLKCGEWKSWHTNGKLKEISYWSKGRICGDQKTFDQEGNIIDHYRYTRSGKKDVIALDLEKQKKREECIAKCKQKYADKKKAREEKKKLKEEKIKMQQKEKSAAPKKELTPPK